MIGKRKLEIDIWEEKQEAEKGCPETGGKYGEGSEVRIEKVEKKNKVIKIDLDINHFIFIHFSFDTRDICGELFIFKESEIGVFSNISN